MHPLEQATFLYGDVYIAVRVFGMRYPVYLAETTPDERHLYRLFLVLEQQKERYAQKKHQEDMERQRRMQQLHQGRNHDA